MANDKYGDCTCAAAGQMIEEWTSNSGKTVIRPTSRFCTWLIYRSVNNTTDRASTRY